MIYKYLRWILSFFSQSPRPFCLQFTSCLFLFCFCHEAFSDICFRLFGASHVLVFSSASAFHLICSLSSGLRCSDLPGRRGVLWLLLVEVSFIFSHKCVSLITISKLKGDNEQSWRAQVEGEVVSSSERSSYVWSPSDPVFFSLFAFSYENVFLVSKSPSMDSSLNGLERYEVFLLSIYFILYGYSGVQSHPSELIKPSKWGKHSLNMLCSDPPTGRG